MSEDAVCPSVSTPSDSSVCPSVSTPSDSSVCPSVSTPSDSSVCPSVSTPSDSSVSLVEIKAETRLVLKAFLRQSLSVPAAERPGRVGGAYKDHNKYSVTVKDTKRQSKDVLKSQDESSSSDEKKSVFKDFIKRLQPRPATLQRQAKGSSDLPQNGSLEKEGWQNGTSPGVSRLREKLEGELGSPSSTSDEEGSESKQQKKKKKKKLKSRISLLFKKKDKEREVEKEKEREKEDELRPQRPCTLTINSGSDPGAVLVSPANTPEFYEEVAGTLERIVQRSKSFKRPCPDPTPTLCKLSPVKDNDSVVKQLVQVLSTEADAINSKIESNPFLRSKLMRLSYPSFAKLLDTFASQAEDTPLPATASPTLRCMAITMEVSRRVVTATGTQRMQGYAERYMENFAPWVKSQGGWENIVQLQEMAECD